MGPWITQLTAVAHPLLQLADDCGTSARPVVGCVSRKDPMNLHGKNWRFTGHEPTPRWPYRADPTNATHQIGRWLQLAQWAQGARCSAFSRYQFPALQLVSGRQPFSEMYHAHACAHPLICSAVESRLTAAYRSKRCQRLGGL